jgi:hypothetical protein
MTSPIISKRIRAKYIRDERWDIVVHLLKLLKDEAETQYGVNLSYEAIVDALTKAGAIKMEVQLIAGKPPRYQIRHLAKVGYPTVEFTVYDNGSLTIVPSEKDML